MTGPVQSPPVGRGGLKLAAALQRFGLDRRPAGEPCVDVGASTGGFTDVLLRAGARHVTAIDVGHGQLHERLRRDRRVTSLERTDFKKASLAVAPGPFGFFAVDVSFVAGRSMLRSLAFRLADGAEGVFLVKPQFELPRHLARAGVTDPALRARALATFRAKAEALGFALVAHADSPVAGEQGTVEILAHLRFLGRTARLPGKPGTQDRGRAAHRDGADRAATPGTSLAHEARTRPESGAPHARPGRGTAQRAIDPRSPQRWFAVATPGLEEVVTEEVGRLKGVSDVVPTTGGTEFRAALGDGAAANLHLRVASRVLLRLGRVEAREFAQLRRGLGRLPWEAFVPADLPVRITATTSRCRLYHTGAIAENVVHALQDRLRAPVRLAPKEGPSDGDADPRASGLAEAGASAEPGADPDPRTAFTRILLRGVGDDFQVSLDASGELLHRRGGRVETGHAPLRETLAAGILALCEHDPSLPLVDPMCGAGTLVLEAAARARRLAPGLGRAFTCERWPALVRAHGDHGDHSADSAPLAAARADARAALLPQAPAPIHALDEDLRALEIARRNAARAGLEADVTFTQAALGAWSPPLPTPGLAILNPPYGRRIEAAGRLWKQIGKALRARFPGWRAGVLVPDPRLAPALGLERVRSHRLFHGGLHVTLVTGHVPGT
jgi:putative N6-adenine-specific DNA methylase